MRCDEPELLVPDMIYDAQGKPATDVEAAAMRVLRTCSELPRGELPHAVQEAIDDLGRLARFRRLI